MAATSNGTKISFTHTPQAKNDVFAATGLTEDSTDIVLFDVMGNDAGGNAKSLYSVDAGGQPDLLLARDEARVALDSADTSKLGAKIWITADGKVAYQATAAVQASLQQLVAGETLEDSFAYAIQLGNGTLSWATASFTIAGENDIAVIGGETSGAVTEDLDVSEGMLTTAGALTIADPDANQSFFVAQDSVAGSGGFGSFSLDASGAWTYKVDNGIDAVQQLKAGESLVDSFTAVSLDGSSSQVVSVVINGANEAGGALHGFESGDFTGWSVLGNAFVGSEHYSYVPTEGNYMGGLFGSGAMAADIASFLGLEADALDLLGNGYVTEGSAMKTTLDVKAGDIVHFDWAFIATDYLPFNDFAVAVIGDGQLLELADIAAVGDFGATGWQGFDYVAPADMTLVVGVASTNVLDGALGPQLLIDNLTIL